MGPHGTMFAIILSYLWQKSPLTSSTRALARRPARSACQERSCSANGYMQAVVLPEPTAPTDLPP